MCGLVCVLVMCVKGGYVGCFWGNLLCVVWVRVTMLFVSV